MIQATPALGQFTNIYLSPACPPTNHLPTCVHTEAFSSQASTLQPKTPVSFSTVFDASAFRYLDVWTWSLASEGRIFGSDRDVGLRVEEVGKMLDEDEVEDGAVPISDNIPY